jgi:hypothetical protein
MQDSPVNPAKLFKWRPVRAGVLAIPPR